MKLPLNCASTETLKIGESVFGKAEVRHRDGFSYVRLETFREVLDFFVECPHLLKQLERLEPDDVARITKLENGKWEVSVER